MSFTCAECEYTSAAEFKQCPRCRSWQTHPSALDGPRDFRPKKLSAIKSPKIERVSLIDPALNLFFNGGMVRSCSYLFSAVPGFGKSTWALQAISFFEHPLYVTSEETEAALKLRAKRLSVNHPHAEFVECVDLELVARHMTDDYDGVVYDSAHRFTTADSSAGAGSPIQTNRAIALIDHMARKMGHVAIIIGHANKEREAAGLMANQHDVAGVIVGEKRAGGGRVMKMDKHRHGPDSSQQGKVLACVLGDRGLDDFRLIVDDGLEEGE